MKKLIICFLIVFTPLMCSEIVFKNPSKLIENSMKMWTLKFNIIWLNNSRLAIAIYKNSYLKDLEPELICAIIKVESNGRNIIGKKNRNGTRDYSYMQICEVHYPKNPKKLMEVDFGIHKGTNYLMWAYNKAKGNIKITAQFYNGGLNHPIKTKNKNVKRYANKVLHWYNVYKITTNNYKKQFLISSI